MLCLLLVPVICSKLGRHGDIKDLELRGKKTTTEESQMAEDRTQERTMISNMVRIESVEFRKAVMSFLSFPVHLLRKKKLSQKRPGEKCSASSLAQPLS